MVRLNSPKLTVSLTSLSDFSTSSTSSIRPTQISILSRSLNWIVGLTGSTFMQDIAPNYSNLTKHVDHLKNGI